MTAPQLDDIKQLAIDETMATRMVLEGTARSALVLSLVACGDHGNIRVASPSDQMPRSVLAAFVEMIGDYRDKLQAILDANSDA